MLKLAKEKSGNHGPYHAECVVLGHPSSSTSSFSLLDPLVRWPYTAADISESYQTTKPLRFRDAILIIYKHENQIHFSSEKPTPVKLFIAKLHIFKYIVVFWADI